MKQSLEYLDFLGITTGQITKIHITKLINTVIKLRKTWFIIGLICGISILFIVPNRTITSIKTLDKEVIYIPAISIDSATKAFMNAIATFESGGDYKIVNGEYLGKYQIGDDMRTELGFGSLNTKEGRIQFLNTPELQDIIMVKSIEYSKKELKDYIQKYSNTKIGAHYVTESGIIAIAHACGISGAKRFLSSNGSVVPNNGRRVTDYLQFNNFKL